MYKIEIDDDVWQALQKMATPLVDTPSTVLRKVLGLPSINPDDNTTLGHKRTVYTRAKGKTRQEEFRAPILRSLFRTLSHSKPAGQVLDDIENDIGSKFNSIDREILKSGRDIRWKNTAQWERAVMVKGKLLRSDSPRGIWALTKKGIAAALNLDD